MAQRRKSSRARRLLLAVGASAGAHLAVLVLLVLAVHGAAPQPDEPPIIISLTRLIAPQRRAPAPPPAPIRPHATRIPPAYIPPLPIPLPPPKALAPDGPLDPRIAAQQAVRGALMATVRCAHPDQTGMDAAERERCRRLFREMGKDAPIYAVDPADHARHDPPVASHGMAVVIGPPPPLPGYSLGQMPYPKPLPSQP